MSEFDNLEIYKSVLEALPTGVYLVDRNRRILFWNSQAERICGYLRQDVVGRFLREHLLATNEEAEEAESSSAEFDPLKLVLRDGKPSTARVSILHKEGYRIPIILQTVPIRNERGNIIGAAECFDDNTASSQPPRRRSAVGRLMCLDEATGFPSKSSMEAFVREQVAFFAERQVEFGIVLIEIDQLDRLRATRGPSAVSNILRIAAQTIANCLRPDDVVGMWTNNRFLVVLAECRETDLARVANRIRKMVGQSEVEWWGDRFTVTAALGGTGCRPGDTQDLLMDRAERSLLESNAAGGNRATLVG